MNEWYYADGSHQRQGPVDDEALAALQSLGHIGADTLVWHEGMAEWQRLGSVAAAPLAGARVGDDTAVDDATAAATPAMLETTSSGIAAAHVPGPPSPYAAPAAPLIHTSGVVTGNEIVYAGFWKRVAAYMIDGIIVGIAGGIVGAVIGGVMGVGFGLNGGLGSGGMVAIQSVSQVIALAMAATFFAMFHASRAQATPGKMAVGIKVARPDGSAITVARGVGRYFALFVSSITLGIGFIMAGFTERKQALHDLMCDTLVVDKWAFTTFPERQRRELGAVTIVILVIGGLLFLVALAAIGVVLATVGGALFNKGGVF